MEVALVEELEMTQPPKTAGQTRGPVVDRRCCQDDVLQGSAPHLPVFVCPPDKPPENSFTIPVRVM